MNRLKLILTWTKQQAKLTIAVIIGAIAGGATTTMVFAAIPDNNGIIHACYTTGLFAKVRIIDSATQSCSNNETAITWNQQGPKGDTGPAGPQGPPGLSSGGQRAYLGVNNDATLDTGYSQGINDYTVISHPDPADSTRYLCFNTTFTPKFSWFNQSSGGPLFAGVKLHHIDNISTAQFIEDRCGSGFNGLVTKSDTNPQTPELEIEGFYSTLVQ